MKNFIRLFVAAWYLFGWLLHVYLGLTSPLTYRGFGSSALIPGYTTLWTGFVMPIITPLALLLAAFEIAVGLMLINKGRWVKAGLVFSILFNLFLVQMGLGYPAPDALTGFMVNRLPNLVFIFIQIPLFWETFSQTLPEIAAARFARLGRSSMPH